MARSGGQDGGQDGTEIQNFAIEFRLAISDAIFDGSGRATGSDARSTVAENGWAGRGGGSDRTRLWRDLDVISYAVHQSRTDAADPAALRAIPATVPVCCFVTLAKEDLMWNFINIAS